ncbi:MAG: tail fiber domain-containing protein, partial [Saprospiraceae bacterium]|nr:tail fiber domain-containing protein [Saprospiraceae bacterium]
MVLWCLISTTLVTAQVGIGVSTPVDVLHIKAAGGAGQGILLETTSGLDGADLTWLNTSGAQWSIDQLDKTLRFNLSNPGFGTRMYMNEFGDIGIGTDPSSGIGKLQVNGFTRTKAVTAFDNSGLAFRTDENLNRMRILDDGRISVGATAPHPSAQFEVASTTGGMLLPRMTGTQREAILNPVGGLQVFDNTSGSGWIYQSEWNEIVAATPGTEEGFILRLNDALKPEWGSLISPSQITSEVPVVLADSIVPIIGDPSQLMVADDNFVYYFVDATNQILVVEHHPQSGLNVKSSMGFGALGPSPTAAAISGNYIFYCDDHHNKVLAVDINFPTTLQIVSEVFVGSSPKSIAISGSYAYVANTGNDALEVIDISNPHSINIVDTLALGGDPVLVVTEGNYAFVADDGTNTLKVIDISNPNNIFLAHSTPIGAQPVSMAAENDVLCIADANSFNLEMVDITNPLSCSVVATHPDISTPISVHILNGVAYKTNSGQLELINVHNSFSPESLQTIQVNGAGYEVLSSTINRHSIYISFNTLDFLKAYEIPGLRQYIQSSNADGSIAVSETNTLGNHSATQNLAMNGNWMSFSGKDRGIFVNCNDWVGIDTQFPSSKFDVNGKARLDGLGFPGEFGPDTNFVGTDGNYIAFGHIGVSEDFIGYGSNSFYLLDSPGGGDTADPNLYVGGKLGVGLTSSTHPLEMASGAHVTAGGVWTNASDIARKSDIRPLSYGLSDVMQLRPVTYRYLADGSPSLGFVAQDMEQIIPEVVSGTEGNKGIAYGL